jgi:hypothetical protein
MVQVEFDSSRVILQKSVGVPQGVARLGFDCPITQVFCKLQGLLVMVCGQVELSEKNVSIAEIAVSPTLRGFVSKLVGDLKPFGVIVNGARKVTLSMMVSVLTKLGQKVIKSTELTVDVHRL